MRNVIMFAMLLVLLTACSREVEKKDDFLGTQSEKVETTRIHVVDNGSTWSSFQIIEVDGHQYLCNTLKGGIVHLESCPCKKKL
jgi:hypothetical protein